VNFDAPDVYHLYHGNEDGTFKTLGEQLEWPPQEEVRARLKALTPLTNARLTP
jgi:hypothetical protein